MFFDFYSFKNVIPELFFLISIFLLILFLISFSISKIYNFPLIIELALYLSIYILFFLFFLYFNNLNIKSSIFNNSLYISYGISYFKLFIIFCSLLSILVSLDFLKFEKINDFEYIILLLFVIFGILILISSNDFLITYISIELQSLSLYVLVTFKKNTIFSTESGIKYFILGSLASILILFGFSIVYGIFGTINFQELALLNIFLINSFDYYYYLFLFSIILILAGLFFKLTVAPFHFWAPDVYEGSPTSITLFMSIVPKLAFLILLIKFLFFIFNSLFIDIFLILIFLSIFSVFIGSILSFKQKKFKRLFSYASIVHVGFLLLAISTGTLLGLQSFFIYFIIYIITSICIWTIFISLRLKKLNTLCFHIINFNSLFFSNPFLSFILTLILFSMAGIPPLAGFWAKYFIFLSLIDSKFIYVSVILIFLSAFSVFYYLRLIKNIYYNHFKTKIEIISFNQINKINSLIIIWSFIFIFFLFVIYPDFILVLSNYIMYSFFF
jgi:NADH-quinone oxidoreductase subunit N